MGARRGGLAVILSVRVDAPALPLLFLDSAWRIALVVIGVGGVIFFHEMGHFLVARWCGVRTEAFSLAFPPNLFVGRREAGGFRLRWIGHKGNGILLPFWRSERDPTEYRVGLIPLGGYVKMAGEGIGEGTGEPDELRSKSVGARAAIFSAGVVMNVIFAFLAFTVAFQVGVPLPAPLIGDVAAGSAAEQAGVRPGDRIVAIDGTPVGVWPDIMGVVAYSDGPVAIEVERDGQRHRCPPVVPAYSEANGFQVIGVSPALSTIVADAAGPARAAGVQSGDRVVAVGETPVRYFHELDGAVARAAARHPDAITITVERDADGAAASRHTVSVPTAGAEARVIGVDITGGLLVRALPEGSPLRAGGLAIGDLVTGVGKKVVGDAGFEAALAAARGGATEFTVIRADGTSVTLTLAGDPALWQSVDGLAVIRIQRVRPGEPGEAAGLQAGWFIQGVDGETVTTTKSLTTHVSGSGGRLVRLMVHVPGEATPREIEARPRVHGAVALGLRGFREIREVTRLGLGGALKAGWDGTVKFAQQVLLTLQALVKRKVRADNLGGPIMIAVVAHDSTSGGLGAMLYFLGILSVNLAILNVLPIPVLDGGHLFFLLIEAVRRRPVSENIQVMAQYAGLLLLLALMVFVTVNDIGRFF